MAAASDRRAASETEVMRPIPSLTCAVTLSCNWAGGTVQYM